jgi:hypothetical protein
MPRAPLTNYVSRQINVPGGRRGIERKSAQVRTRTGKSTCVKREKDKGGTREASEASQGWPKQLISFWKMKTHFNNHLVHSTPKDSLHGGPLTISVLRVRRSSNCKTCREEAVT